jgi:hypothetical protein
LSLTYFLTTKLNHSFKILINKYLFIQIKGLKKNTNADAVKIESKLKVIHSLIQEYENIREEKMNRLKDKLEKVINSCDVFIQQRRRKCY